MSKLIATKPIVDLETVPACDTDDAAVMPAEHLEARICELAGHITAATARYLDLDLVADFDRRGCWAQWEMTSCAQWLAWKCQVAPNTAREHVRIARALRDLPFLRGEFAAARLSYAKVRALTRIATADNEKDLAEMAVMMTAGQLDRFARAFASAAGGSEGDRRAALRRKLTWNQQPAGMRISLQLPPADAAVVLQALRAMLGDLDHPHEPPETSPGQRLAERDAAAGLDWQAACTPREKNIVPAEDLADALVTICGDYLAGKVRAAENADVYQVIIHAGTGTVTDAPRPMSAGASAGNAPAGASRQAMAYLKDTLPLLAFPEPHPAWPWRGHVEDGGHVDPATAQMIACDATISTMLHGGDGTVLNVGRRSRKPSAALRRAVRERDRYRCRFPGCHSRRVDVHHVQFWANGGETSLDNCCSLCKGHHRLVHSGRVFITRTGGGGFGFHLEDGTLVSSAPPSPGGSAEAIAGCHDADVAYHTIVPPHSGERLDLHEAIWVCLSGEQMREARREEEAERLRQEQAIALAA